MFRPTNHESRVMLACFTIPFPLAVSSPKTTHIICYKAMQIVFCDITIALWTFKTDCRIKRWCILKLLFFFVSNGSKRSGKAGILFFIIIVQFMMCANSRMRFGLLIVFVCLYITPSHYYHCANLSEDIELIKCLSDIFCRVCEYD